MCTTIQTGSTQMYSCPPQLLRQLFCFVSLSKVLIRLLFELGCPGMLFFAAPTLPVYTTGQKDGLVVDIGWEEVRVLPVYSGFPVWSALSYAPLGMYLVRAKLLSLLQPDLEVGRHMN